MSLFLASLILFVLSGITALLSLSFKFNSGRITATATIAACVAGLASLLPALQNKISSINLPLNIPGGQFWLAIDPLSALFLIPLFALSACAAIYALRYVKERRETASFLLNMLVASMAVVFTARNGMLFLITWELMTIFSFLLVVWDYQREESRRAGWIYLVSTHIGTAFIIALFAMAWDKCGSLNFDDFPKAFAILPFGAVAALALLGFGTKAGFFPLHVWLPKAHPAAPSHISALMSGIMIKTGIYGIIRIVALCPPAPEWFGWTLIFIGVVSGVIAVLFALAQHDIKQLLAYHSVENIGIIAIGLGIGYIGLSAGRTDIAFLGFAGGLLHVINHAFFKGLLFLGAGSVYHATGTRDMEKLGGLQRAMPATAACFLIGSAAISALPPLNGFISELMIYIGAFKSLSVKEISLAGLLSLTGLALIGGLAAACFAKACGITFLGQLRSQLKKELRESPKQMLIPMFLLSALCLIIGICPLLILPIIAPAATMLCGSYYTGINAIFTAVSVAGVILILVALSLWLFKNALLSGRKNRSAPTWACGYSAPSPRMQYTASSFAQPLLAMFGLGATAEPIKELFPSKASFRSQTQDLAKTKIYRPLFELIEEKLSILRRIQRGSIHAYVLYLALALLFVLVWTLI